MSVRIILFVSLVSTGFLLSSSRVLGVDIPYIRKKQYTPLVFFTIPKGSTIECDEMEKLVSQVEKELSVRVERLDVTRNRAAQATLSLLTQHGPPYLYNRESCQTIFINTMNKQKGDKSSTNMNTQSSSSSSSPSSILQGIDKDRVRAWAKGRYLPPPGMKFGIQTNNKNTNTPIVVTKEDNAISQEELERMKEETLTPMQLKGKEAMKQRTNEKIKKNKQ